MSRNIRVNTKSVVIGGKVYLKGQTAIVSDADFLALQGTNRHLDGTVTDLGRVADPNNPTSVQVQAVDVALPAALTSAVAAAATPTKVEFDKVVADLAVLRATIVAMLTSLEGPGLPMA